MTMECKWKVVGMEKAEYKRLFTSRGIFLDENQVKYEGFEIKRAIFTFRNAKIIYVEFTKVEDGSHDRTIEIITKDNAMVERLRKFVGSGIFIFIINKKLGSSGIVNVDI